MTAFYCSFHSIFNYLNTFICIGQRQSSYWYVVLAEISLFLNLFLHSIQLRVAGKRLCILCRLDMP